MHITRRSEDRGLADFGWLQSRHTFSFGEYYDSAHMGFGPLRVINEDRVAPGQGFGTHAHRDMEILSWVLEGSLEHKDSIGTGAKIRPGELQRMTAGTGVTHSEFNGSQSEPVHFLQIWVMPVRNGLPPGYEQVAFSAQQLDNQWCLIASGSPANGAVTIHQDVELYTTRLGAGRSLDYVALPGRKLWLQIARGSVETDGDLLRAGDGAAWPDPSPLRVHAQENAEVLLFDMTP